MRKTCGIRFLYRNYRPLLQETGWLGSDFISVCLQYVTAERKPAFLRQAREFLFFPLLPREASKSVSIFDRETGSKPERLRSGFCKLT